LSDTETERLIAKRLKESRRASTIPHDLVERLMALARLEPMVLERYAQMHPRRRKRLLRYAMCNEERFWRLLWREALADVVRASTARMAARLDEAIAMMREANDPARDDRLRAKIGAENALSDNKPCVT
jgi:hypothetical protein